MLHDQPGLLELLKDKRRRDLEGSMMPVANDDPDDLVAPEDEQLVATMRKKRRSSILRAQLRDNGYSDLAKMLSIHDERGQ